MTQLLRRILLAPFRKRHDPALQTWRDITMMLDLYVSVWCWYQGKYWSVYHAGKKKANIGYIFIEMLEWDDPAWGDKKRLLAENVKWTVINPALLKPTIDPWENTVVQKMSSYEDVAWEDMDSSQ